MTTRKSVARAKQNSGTRRARATKGNGSAMPAGGPEFNSPAEVLNQEETRSELTAAAVVGVAAVLVEAELLPGILLGVAAMMLPKIFPGITDFARPLVKSSIGLGYKAMVKTQQLVAEASDHAQDMLAEIRSEARRAPALEARRAGS